MKISTLIIAAASLACAAGAHAADIDAGKKKAAEVCGACHGPDGNSTIPVNPKLAGQHEDYLIAALKAYKSGERTDPTMAAMAAGLDAKDIANVAAWFASQRGALSQKK